MSRPTVLVTGGAGYIGSHAALALVDEGWSVVVLDNLSTGKRWLVPQGAAFVEGNAGDRDLVARVIADHGVGAIMHFAGSIIVPESVENPLKYYGNNSCVSRSLIEAAVAGGVSHFLFSSTAAVYGEQTEMPIDEARAPAPINPYGRSKLMTEIMLADVAAASPMNYCALRYFNVAGADPQGRSGQSADGSTHLIKVAVETIIGKREQVQVFGDDFPTRDGTGIRDYIHVSDLADAHVRSLEAMMAAPTENFVMNCGYGRGFSVMEVLDAVGRVAGQPVNKSIAPRRAGDPPELVSDASRLRSRVGWTPRYDSLDLIVETALNWERRLAERQLG